MLSPGSSRLLLAGVMLSAISGAYGIAPQHQSALPPPANSEDAPVRPHRQRLILHDGTYQIVMSYRVAGDRVIYVSAERGGAEEDLPLALVDLAATKQWESEHGPGTMANQQGRPPVLSPELQKEEQERAMLAPEVAPGLHLDPQSDFVALDTFQGRPELVPLLQSSADLTDNTQHGILKAIINPHAATHQIVLLKGEKSDVQIHVPDPVFFLKTDDAQPSSGSALTVDTHGAAAQADRKPKASTSDYVIVRVDVREGARVVASFNTNALGTTRQDEQVIDTTATLLPGGHWMKIAPTQPMLIGEYALVEVLGANQVNLGVWDFGIHPTAPENRDVILPEKRRAQPLEHRPK